MKKIGKKFVSVFVAVSLFMMGIDSTGLMVWAEENTTETEMETVPDVEEIGTEMEGDETEKESLDGEMLTEEVSEIESETQAEGIAEDEALMDEVQEEEMFEDNSVSETVEDSGKCGDNLTWTLKNGTLTISGTGEMYCYNHWYKDEVEEIVDNVAPWGKYWSVMKKLIIEEGITSIGNGAFCNCSEFTGDLVIPKGVTAINGGAFEGCSGFTGSLIIPEGVTEIGGGAFFGCSGFTGSLIIPEGVTKIGGKTMQGAFCGCRGFTGSLTIPKSVSVIGDHSFECCSGFTSLTIMEGVAKIGHGAFKWCDGFTGSLVIPKGVTEIGMLAFEGCSGFTGSLSIPEGVTKIGDFTFQDCSGFTGNLKIPEGVTEIGVQAFSGCGGFTGSLKIPEGVTKIGSGAFSRCHSLSGIVYIPISVTMIGGDAFGFMLEMPFYLNPIIYGVSGSYAESYAKEHIFPFVPYNAQGPQNEISGQSNNANIYIIDADFGIPIAGASVNSVAADSGGYLSLPIAEGGEEKSICVTADGYIPYTSVKMLKPNGTYYLSMMPTDGELEIISAEATIGTRVTNLLADKLYLQHTSEDISASDLKVTMEIAVKARGDVKNYELLQSEKLIASSTEGKFLMPVDLDSDTNPLTNLLAKESITVRVTDINGNVATGRLGIYIGSEEDAEERTGFLDIAPEVGAALLEDIPFLGGAASAYGVKNPLPFELTIERDGKVKIAINKSASKSMEGFKEEYDQLKSRAKNLSDAALVFGGTPNPFGAGCFETEASIVGYGEGYIDMTKPGTFGIRVDVIATAKGNAVYTQYFMAGAIPFFITVEGRAELTGKATLAIKVGDSTVQTVGGAGTLSGEVSLAAKAGVGIDGMINVGVSGTGLCNYVWKPLYDYTKIWLKAWMELRAECFGWDRDLWKSPEATHIVYESCKENANASVQSFYDDMVSQLYDSGTYTVMDRSYLKKASSEEMYLDRVADGTGGILQSYVYPGAEPKLVAADNKFYLFWLQDIPTRSSENRAAIVYAFSDDGVNFTEPKQLVDEGENQTFDNGVDIYAEGGKIYVCWQDAAESFASGINLDEVVKKQKISYAVVEASTGEVVSHQTVTENAGCYLQPKIYVRDGQVQIAWIQNSMTSANGLWGSDNQENLQKYDSVSGTVSTFSLGSGKEKIISMDGVAGNSQSGVVYVLDEDGSMQTVSDRKIYFDTRFGTGGSQTALTINAGMYSSPVAEGGNIYWYSDGNISYTTVGSNAVSQIYQEKRTDIGSEFLVLSEGEHIEILWESIDHVTENVVLYGISSSGSGQWTNPYVIEQTDSEMTGAVAGSLYHDVPYIAYTHIKNQKDGSKCYSICVTQKKNVTNTALEYAGYEYEDFKPGQVLPITIRLTNKGNTAVESVEIKMDGTVLGTEAVHLDVGDSKAVTLGQYTVPIDTARYAEHTLTVSAVSESDISDNDYAIGIGYTDMKVLCSERLQGESTWLDISVLNDSSIPSEATLNIRADREDGRILYTEELGNIEGGKGISLTVNLLLYEDTCCTYFVEVVTGEEDVIEGNNIQLVYTGYGTDIRGGDLVREPVVYTVTFQSNGGSEVEDVQAEEGENVPEPQIPVREGYRFKGWYLGGEQYDFRTFLTGNITLTAEWEEYETVAVPSASIESGSRVKRGTKVSLTCAAGGADIYYAIGGEEPTKDSFRFIEPIEITDDMVIKAFAAKEGFKDSEKVTFIYTVSDSAEEPEPGDDPFEDEKYGDGVLPEDIPAGGVPQGLWIAGIKDYTYTGKAIKPVVRVYDGEKRLKEKTDYTISYKNNIKANDASAEKAAPTVIVKGKGNYSGTETAVFKILPVDLRGSEVSIEDITLAYNKKVQKPVPVVTFHGKKLKNKTDFMVSYPDLEKGIADAFKKVGTYDVVVSARKDAKGNVTGNFTGEYTVKLTITDKLLIGKATVKRIPNQSYQDGNFVEPVLKVTMKGMPDLVEGTDYTVEYKNNTEIGTATALITGIGKYAGTKNASFKITGKPFDKNTINVIGITNKEYDGTAQTLNLQIISKDGTGQLKEGVDYKVSYSGNKNAGTASVTVSGINNYSGTITRKFKITAFNLAEDAKNPQTRQKVSGLEEEISVKYVKGGAKPSLSLKFNGTSITEGKDYTIAYKNNKAAAGRDADKSPVILIKGKGNFKGTLTKPFTIETKALDDIQSPVTLTVADVGFVDKAGKYKSKPVLTDVDGKKLTAGKDYESKITYRLLDDTELDNRSKAAVGTVIKVIVTGKGNYAGGNLEGIYKITKSDFSKATISIKTQTYTGKEIMLDESAFKQVKAGGADITNNFGTDYEIVEGSYRNNIKKGTASVIIKGKGNYGGTKTVQFKIRSKGFLWWWRS